MQELVNSVRGEKMKKMAEIRPGYRVRVHQKIREGDKERVQVFEGVVIKISSGRGPNKTFTARKVVEGVGVEKIFPFQSSNVIQIEIKKKSEVRQSKLYYTRARFGKKARMEGDLVDIKAVEEAKEDVEKNPRKKEAVAEKAAEPAEKGAKEEAPKAS